MPKNLIPLSELPAFEAEAVEQTKEPQLFWDVELPPHIDSERLLFDAGHMRRLQKIGCFGLNHFFSYQGETTQYEPTVTGMNPDGTAIAGRKASILKRAESSKEAERRHLPDGVDKYNYYDNWASHGINRAELSQRVSDTISSNQRISQHEAWATRLDEVTQRSIRRSAYRSLMSDVPLPSKAVEYGSMSLASTSILLDSINNDPEHALQWVGMLILNRAMYVAGDSYRNKHRTGETHIKERRWSLFEDVHPDRYLALNGLTRVNSLIKYRK